MAFKFLEKITGALATSRPPSQFIKMAEKEKRKCRIESFQANGIFIPAIYHSPFYVASETTDFSPFFRKDQKGDCDMRSWTTCSLLCQFSNLVYIFFFLSYLFSYLLS